MGDQIQEQFPLRSKLLPPQLRQKIMIISFASAEGFWFYAGASLTL
jgi:hypothetical protein